MATSGKQLSSLPSASSIAGNNEFLTWVGNNTAQKVSRDDFIKSLPTYRQPSTTYSAGNIAYHSALPTGYYLECTTEGTSSSGDLTISSPVVGDTVTDGTVVWRVKNVDDLEARHVATDCNAEMSGCALVNNDTANKPDGITSGIVVTAGSAWLIQTAVSVYPFNGATFSRQFANGSWTPWQQQEAIVAKSINANGYIKYASGLIVQWGMAGVDRLTTVTCPVTFTQNPKIVATPVSSTSESNLRVTVGDITTSEFKLFLHGASGSTYDVCWFVIGY